MGVDVLGLFVFEVFEVAISLLSENMLLIHLCFKSYYAFAVTVSK